MLSQQRAKKSLYYVVIRMILRALLQPNCMFDFDNNIICNKMAAAQTAFDAADHNNTHLPDLVRKLLEENKHFAAGFDKCMSLGAKKKV
jgi:hypothetical protein